MKENESRSIKLKAYWKTISPLERSKKARMMAITKNKLMTKEARLAHSKKMTLALKKKILLSKK